MAYKPTFLTIPMEVRFRILGLFFDDLVEELSDNLFAVFQIYDHMYDYTASEMESHVGKTGLTAVLRVNKQLYGEALSVLCERAEFVISVVGDYDDEDEEREDVRFSQNSRHLQFAKHLKINFFPVDDATNERFLSRVHSLLESIQYGANLRTLEIMFSQPSGQLSSFSMDHILTTLETLRTKGNSIKVYLGNLSEECLCDKRLSVFLSPIKG
jgi:hypothetical protein